MKKRSLKGHATRIATRDFEMLCLCGFRGMVTGSNPAFSVDEKAIFTRVLVDIAYFLCHNTKEFFAVAKGWEQSVQHMMQHVKENRKISC